jgi:cell division protein FtsB
LTGRKAFIMSPFGRTLALVLSAIGLSLTMAAQQTSAPDDLTAQVARLSALIEKQQQQIDALQRSHTELIRELRASRSPMSPQQVDAAATARTAPRGSDFKASSETPASARMQSTPDSHDASGSRQADYAERQDRGHGINLGDRVRVGGYGSLRFETNDVAQGNNIPGGSAAGFTFRRLVLTADARPASRLRVYSEIEFERLFEIGSEKQSSRVPGNLNLKQTLEGNNGGELAVEQAWGQFNFAENHGFRAGVVLVPVGRFNLLHDDDYWDIPRRTLTDRDAPVLPVKSAWRDLGAGFTGSFNVGQAGKLDYQIYALNGAALDFNLEHELTSTAGSPGTAELVLNSELQLTSGFFDGSKSATAFAWRASYSPSLHGEFAISGYHGKYAPSFLSFRESLTTLAYDHKWRWRGFETEAEAVYTGLGNLDNVLAGFAVAAFNSVNSTALSSSAGGLTSATVEMELANLSRARYGFWTDFKYHARPQWLKRSFLGKSFEDPQIIPILRYERVWLNGVTDNIDVSGFGPVRVISFSQENLQQERVTAGLSYRPVTQFAMQAAYEHNRRVDGSQLIFPRVSQDSTNGLILGMSFGF